MKHIEEKEIWTEESISRFWNLVASESRLSHLYFSHRHSKNIIKFAQAYGPLNGEVLDFGCGPGFLSMALVQLGLSTTSVDSSQTSIELTKNICQSYENWKGASLTSSLPKSTKFDWIFSIETFEHLRDEWIDGYFILLFNKLKKGGKIFISTPFEENLDNQFIICPSCESKFHRWGHLRSVSKNLLLHNADKHGFKTIFCNAIDLDLTRYYSNKYSTNYNHIIHANNLFMLFLFNKIRDFIYKFYQKPIIANNNLILIATKP